MWARRCLSCARCYDNGRSHTHPPEQVEDVLVVHANAAVRGKGPDRGRLVGAVNGIFTPEQRQSPGTHWIAGRPARDHGWPCGVIGPDFRGRCPGGIDVLALHPRPALPLLPRLADCDGVADGPPIPKHEIEPPFGSLDHNRPRLPLAVIANNLTRTGWSSHPDDGYRRKGQPALMMDHLCRILPNSTVEFG